MSFIDALLELFLGESGIIPPTYEGSAILLFAVCCTIMSILVIILDRISYSVLERSYLNLSYGKKISTTIRLVFLWSIGAGIGGYFGASFNIFEITRNACVMAGISWPFILPRLIESFSIEQIKQKEEKNGK